MLRHSSTDGLRWVAWANLIARAFPIADTGKLSLAHATRQFTCVGVLAVSGDARRTLFPQPQQAQIVEQTVGLEHGLTEKRSRRPRLVPPAADSFVTTCLTYRLADRPNQSCTTT